MRKLTTKEYIEVCQTVHGYKYDYSNTVYAHALAKLFVTCKKHGPWEVLADAHKRGTGCPSCKGDLISLQKQVAPSHWLAKCKEVHGDKFDYSKSDFKTGHYKVEIICPEHGSFFQSPANHTSGKGCASCMKNGYRPNKAGYFYVLHCFATNSLKIGITNRKVEDRLKPINRTSGNNFAIFKKFYFENGRIALNLETYCLSYLKQKYSQPTEIFDGSTECFIDVDREDLLRYIYECIDSLAA